MELGDDGYSAFVDAAGTYEPGADMWAVTEMLESLNVPDYVLDHIGVTRALDGMQQDTGDGLTATWTYHPDDGLSMTLVDANVE